MGVGLLWPWPVQTHTHAARSHGYGAALPRMEREPQC
jgi:hypothetical protein